ncbi:D-alanyl-D-alanine carboxypeptidase family protein [Candidatus Sumerlaeota bacterium]|nr:D-alanyl-D-alanine carboxypeptidase family protein [Candidatus Sumerlaeota bacterium]
MRRRLIPMTAVTFSCVLAMVACAQAPVSSKPDVAPASIAGVASPDELIEALGALGGTSATRLRPEIIRAILRERDSDAAVKSAFDGMLASGTPESQRALLRVMELHFIRDPKASVLDLLGPELSEHFRQFAWDPADYPGGPEGPNEKLADVMVDALDLVRPERRVNTSRNAVVLKEEATEDVWNYMTNEWVSVPGQEERKLNRHAAESYVRMREAAKQDGVSLIILSSERSRAKAEANAARANNSAAVASFSAHSLGLAVDFQMSQGDFQVEEITTRPMGEVIRMRESPVHKWLFLRGEEFGWYPYQNEPWHWEYNPIGFRTLYWSDFPGGAPKRINRD